MAPSGHPNPRSDPQTAEQQAAITNFVRTQPRTRVARPTRLGGPPRPADRRRAGLLIGAAFGLVYAALGGILNGMLAPGVPLSQPPFGPAGNALAGAAAGAVLGLATAWPKHGVTGVSVGALTAVALLEARAWLDPAGSPLLRAPLPYLFFVMLGLAVVLILLVPLLLALRWAAEVQAEERHLPLATWRRARAPLVVLLAAGVLGANGVLPVEVRQAMANMDGMIEAGLVAPNHASLPAALRGAGVGEFERNAHLEYNLEWHTGSLNDGDGGGAWTDVGTPRTGQLRILAHFANGWTLNCLYLKPDSEPICHSE